jgi:hypothetical protein
VKDAEDKKMRKIAEKKEYRSQNTEVYKPFYYFWLLTSDSYLLYYQVKERQR